MTKVNVTELRARLPAFVSRVSAGETVEITSRGKVVARLVPVVDRREDARRQLALLRDSCTVGDVILPTGADWDAAR